MITCSIRPDSGNKITTETPGGQGGIMLRLIVKNGSIGAVENKFAGDKERFTNYEPPELKVDKATCQTYVEYREDPFDPTFAVQMLEEVFVEQYTMRFIMIDNPQAFRIEGIYQHNDATLRCKHEMVSGSTSGKYMRMNLSIVAPTFELLRKIYFDFREGKLLPNENWETPQIEKSCWFRPTTWKIWS